MYTTKTKYRPGGPFYWEAPTSSIHLWRAAMENKKQSNHTILKFNVEHEKRISLGQVFFAAQKTNMAMEKCKYQQGLKKLGRLSWDRWFSGDTRKVTVINIFFSEALKKGFSWVEEFFFSRPQGTHGVFWNHGMEHEILLGSWRHPFGSCQNSGSQWIMTVYF